MDADLWASENVKVALVPIVAKAQADERARIRRELISAFDDGQIVWYRDLMTALDRIIPEVH